MICVHRFAKDHSGRISYMYHKHMYGNDGLLVCCDRYFFRIEVILQPGGYFENKCLFWK